MRIAGERVRRHRWIHTDRFVVTVEAVIPPDDPGEPCFEAETVQLLKEVERRARLGDVECLKWHGKVYEVVDVA
jgi:hypothetical protein